MLSRARLRQTSHAANSAIETPSGTHRDFVPRRKGPQIPFHESGQAPDSTGSLCPPLLPRACSLADLQPQSSANKEQRPTIYESKNFKEKTKRHRQRAQLFQKEIHAVKVDDSIAVVQCIHPQDSADSCATLRQCEVGQCRNAKFRRRRFEVANLKIVDLSGTNFPCHAPCKMRRDACGFHWNAD